MRKVKGFIGYIADVLKGIYKVYTGIFGAILHVIGGVVGLITTSVLLGLVVCFVVYLHFRSDYEAARELAYDKLSTISETDFNLISDTEVFDKDGALVGTINAGHYEYAELTTISKYVSEGYIAVEDRRFKTHNGVDLVGTVRAGIALVKHSGEITQGGSTITQQVIKNNLLTQEQTFKRKMVEIMLAPTIEKRYGKDKIMEFYCNTNYYGNRCYGVQAASKFYFGKDVYNLKPHEAALLIGLSNNPSAYDPIKHPEKALEKRSLVMATMLKEGVITQEEFDEYSVKELNIVQEYAEGTSENYQTSYAIHCTALELMRNEDFKFRYTFKDKQDYEGYTKGYSDKYLEKSDLIRAGGFSIYTSLDSNIQGLLQKSIDDNLKDFKEKDSETKKYTMQSAGVCVDNDTGNVIAIVGGRGTDDEFNRAYLSARQPGSTIKPLIDYTPAFDSGKYSPSTKVTDQKLANGPSNAGGYFGAISIREAVARSLNTVAWQVLADIGVDTGLGYLDKLKFQKLTFLDNKNLSVSLGGFTNGVRVVDMAKGYSTLASGGVHIDKTCITRIVNKSSELFNAETDNIRVYTEDSSYMITDVLKGVLNESYGTGHGVKLAEQIAAGKTGTTNNYKDAWFCGFTKYYTTSIWMGYDNGEVMNSVTGGSYPGRIWNQFMEEIHKGKPVIDWNMPASVYKAGYDYTGVETTSNSGKMDLFSSVTKLNEEARLAKEKEDAYVKTVKELIAKWKAFNIKSVEDVYLIEDKYREIKDSIALILSDSERSVYGEEAEVKYAELNAIKDSMSDTIEDYEEEKANKLADKIILDKEKAIIERAENAKDIAFDAFHNALSELKSSKYKIGATDNKMLKAKEKLDRCREYDEYTNLARELSNEVIRLNTLPTKEEYEATIKAEEEARKAEEERLKLEAEINLNNSLAVVETPVPVDGGIVQ